jgi:hypothetical protein
VLARLQSKTRQQEFRALSCVRACACQPRETSPDLATRLSTPQLRLGARSCDSTLARPIARCDADGEGERHRHATDGQSRPPGSRPQGQKALQSGLVAQGRFRGCSRSELVLSSLGRHAHAGAPFRPDAGIRRNPAALLNRHRPASHGVPRPRRIKRARSLRKKVYPRAESSSITQMTVPTGGRCSKCDPQRLAGVAGFW